MEQHTHTTSDIPEIEFNLANLRLELNDELSDVDFKPMTDGLGFRDKREEKKAKIIPRKQTKTLSEKKDLLAKNPVHRDQSTTMRPMESRTTSQKEIYEAFYGKKQPVIPAKKVEKSITVEEASSIQQFGAWIIDVLFLAFAVAFTTGLFGLISGLGREAITQAFTGSDFFLFLGVMFILYYVVYFTILDLGTSPGKTFMGLKMMRTDSKPLRAYHTFIRSLITIFSFIALGVPLIMDFQGKLSDTKIVKA